MLNAMQRQTRRALRPFGKSRTMRYKVSGHSLSFCQTRSRPAIISRHMARPATIHASTLAIHRSLLLPWLGCLLLCLAPAVAADHSTPNNISIAAAADTKFALEDLIAAFQKDHPDIKIQATYGSSGNFYAQLSQRAPFD